MLFATVLAPLLKLLELEILISYSFILSHASSFDTALCEIISQQGAGCAASAWTNSNNLQADGFTNTI
jgi:hypothetical protein